MLTVRSPPSSSPSAATSSSPATTEVTTTTTTSSSSSSSSSLPFKFRSLKDQLRFKHHLDQIIEEEKSTRRKLSSFETRYFNALVDSVVQSNIIGVRKHDERVKSCSREAHFRLAIEEERSAWCCVIEDLMRQYERSIVIQDRDKTGYWKSVRIPHQKMMMNRSSTTNDYDANDDEHQPKDSFFPSSNKTLAPPNNVTTRNNSTTNNSTITQRRPSSVTSPIKFLIPETDSSPASLTEFPKITTYSPDEDENVAGGGQLLVDSSAFASAGLKLKQKQQKNGNKDSNNNKFNTSPTKRRGSNNNKQLTASSLFGSSKRKTDNNNQSLSVSNHNGRPNPFSSIIDKKVDTINKSDAAKQLPEVTKQRLENLLLKHGERNEAGNAVVVRTAEERKIRNMTENRNKKEEVLARSLNPTANDMNGLF